MKKIATLLLLVAASITSAISASAQFTSPEENARQSRAAAKQQQKAMKRSAKNQRKAMKRYQKAQQKAIKKSQQNRAH